MPQPDADYHHAAAGLRAALRPGEWAVARFYRSTPAGPEEVVATVTWEATSDTGRAIVRQPSAPDLQVSWHGPQP